MARSKQQKKQPVQRSNQEMMSAKSRIKHRLAEIESFDLDCVQDRSDSRIRNLENKLDDLRVSVLGAETVQYERYKYPVIEIDRASMNYLHSTPIEDARDGIRKGLASANSQLEAIRDGFQEDLEDSEGSGLGKALKAYEGLELHPAIERAARKLF